MYILLSFCGRSVASVEVLVSSRLILILSRLYCSCCGWVPVNWRREMLYNMWVPSGGDEKRHFPILRIYSGLRESKYKSPSIADMRLTRGLATSPLSSSLCVSRSACLSNSLSLSRSLSLSSSLVLFLCFSPFRCSSVFLSMSMSVSIYVCLCLCMYLSMSLSLYLLRHRSLVPSVSCLTDSPSFSVSAPPAFSRCQSFCLYGGV